MEAKIKSENEKANLEMVLESISEDLRTNANSIDKLLTSIGNLNGKIDNVISKNNREGDQEYILKEIKLGFTKLSESQSKYSFSIEKLQNISDALERNRQEQNPSLLKKVIHHHHISKGIWVAALLFFCLSFESAAWLNTENKLNQYLESDTKYRLMRLDTSSKSLQIYLDSLDARYKLDPNLRKIVIELEEQYLKNIERLEKAELLKQEAKDLENRVHLK